MDNKKNKNNENRIMKTFIVGACLVLGAATSVSVSAAVFMKYDGVDGESKTKPATPGSVATPKPTPKPGLLLPAVQPARSTAATPMVPTKQKISLPTRAFPDLTIIEVIKMPGFDNKFQVKVQNIGNATASGAVLQGEDTTGLGGGGTMPIPTLTPNKYSAMIFQVPSANIDHGDRIKFFADAYKKVYESNENNNVRYFKVP